jgi:hypothetical protein
MNKSLQFTQSRLERFFIEESNKYCGKGHSTANPTACLQTACQALFWGCALIEFYEDEMNGYLDFMERDPDFPIIQGFRHARTRVDHQLLKLLYITKGTRSMEHPMPFFEIRWKKIEDLPPLSSRKLKEQKKLQKFYGSHLQDESVRDTIQSLIAHMERVREWASSRPSESAEPPTSVIKERKPSPEKAPINREGAQHHHPKEKPAPQSNLPLQTANIYT